MAGFVEILYFTVPYLFFFLIGSVWVKRDKKSGSMEEIGGQFGKHVFFSKHLKHENVRLHCIHVLKCPRFSIHYVSYVGFRQDIHT